jgi:demethylmenaquinone methyltransferase/2-methoxy-6-polyprenyl-1,4-benzoquinol methylase
MFDAIAGRYDLLNHLLSAGIDRRWRRRAIAALALTGRERLLDLCTGTADLALAVARARPSAAHVVGLDFASAMLRLGRAKILRAGLNARIALVRGDATRLPIGDASVDAIAVAFGVRNVNELGVACREMLRVLKPGGRLVILEFAVPTVPVVGALYLWYLHRVLPRVGRALSRHHGAYGYLSESIDAFLTPDELVKTLRQSGFRAVEAVPLTFGTVSLYVARRGYTALSH